LDLDTTFYEKFNHVLRVISRSSLCVFVLRRTVPLLAHDGQAVSTVWSMAWLFYRTHQFNNLGQCPGAHVQRIHSKDVVKSPREESAYLLTHAHENGLTAVKGHRNNNNSSNKNKN
jgi:hypothetical protein